jgi:hypothetical protein
MGPIGSLWRVRTPLEHVMWPGGELVALRAWRLAWWLPDGGLRLASLSRDTIWHGPVLTADRVPTADPRSGTGVYATKPGRRPRISVAGPFQRPFDWLSGRDTWVWGWVSLYGQVVEHVEGYRAEAAIVRRLRLGVQTLLAFPDLPSRQRVIRELEDRYQCRVRIGWWERRKAFRLGWDYHLARQPLPRVAVLAPPPAVQVAPPVPTLAPVVQSVPRPPQPLRPRRTPGFSRDGLAFDHVVRAFQRAEKLLGTEWRLKGRGHCPRVVLHGIYSRVVRHETRSWQRFTPGHDSAPRFVFPKAVVVRAARILHVPLGVLVCRGL